MKITVHFKGPDTSNDMVFTNVYEAGVTEDGQTLNIRSTERVPENTPLAQPTNVLNRIPIGNISHWTVVDK